MNVRLKKLSENAIIPTYGSDGAACFDLYASESGTVTAGSSALASTGLAVEVPPGFEMQIRPRSGLFAKQRVMAVFGTVDEDYRGEVKVMLTHLGGQSEYISESYTWQRGERIAQAIIVPVERARFIEAAELSRTHRGEGGFGSSGK